MKKALSAALVLLAIFTLLACSGAKNDSQATLQTILPAPTPTTTINAAKTDAPAPAQNPAGSTTQTSLNTYQNTDYGFAFYLPESWKDFTILTEQWEGLAADEDAGEKVVQTGPQITIRHPGWTEETPRQDIPIMVFTLSQWDELHQDKFHIGAAPIGPSELGRNSKYVFGLPARYNFAYPEGYEEVDQLMKTNPLHPDENYSK